MDKPAWWDGIQPRVDAACKRGGELTAEEISIGVFSTAMDGRFESPIEAIFAAWWCALCRYTTGREIALDPQAEIVIDGTRYRADFTVMLDAHPGTYGSGVLNDWPKVAIELDGHQFHERTKEQVTYRNQRDRALQGAGWKVLHVSGSELWRDPEECVTGVLNIVSSEFGSFWSEYWAALGKKRAAERAAVNQVGAQLAGEAGAEGSQTT